MNVYSSCIHNSPKLEITQIAVSGWVIKGASTSDPWSTVQHC